MITAKEALQLSEKQIELELLNAQSILNEILPEIYGKIKTSAELGYRSIDISLISEKTRLMIWGNSCLPKLIIETLKSNGYVIDRYSFLGFNINW